MSHKDRQLYAWKKRSILVLLLLLSLNIELIEMQTPAPKNDTDDIVVIVESTPYSLKFSVEDTESYEIQDVICKSVKSLEESENLEHTCDNLDACSTYLASLTIKSLSDQATFDKTIEATTDYIAPTTKISNIVTYIESINMQWISTDTSCVSEYVIEVKSVDKEFKWTVAKDKNQLLIDGLSPCQDHNIQLKTYNINTELISNLTTISATEYAEPGNVTVTIEPYKNVQVRVFWEPPQYKTCISYYYLKWAIQGCMNEVNLLRMSARDDETVETIEPENPDADADACEWFANLTDPNSKEYVITNLRGCENYQFQMFINSDVNAKSETTYFTAPEQIPGVIKTPTAEVSATNITLTWVQPTTNNKCVRLYGVRLIGPLQRSEIEQKIQEKDTINTDVYFDDLDPCGQYNITFWAVSLSGTSGPDVSLGVETLEAQPTAIRNYNVEREPYALNISWDPPEFADLCLNGYRLTGWKDENIPDPAFDQVTNDSNVRIEGLFSCQSYTIQVIPRTKNDMDGELKQIETQTDAVEAAAPNNFQAIGLHPNSLELSAQDSDVNNKCETIFARFVCELSKTVDVPFKTAERYVEGQVGGISFKALLSPLSPYTDYKCNVALFNIAGWSPNRTIIKKTEPYFPDPPEVVNLKARTNTTINFNWQEPKYPNGNIKLYILHFQAVKANYYIPPSCSSVVREPIIRQTSSLEQSFSTLLPYTIYSIQVAAENEYGVGEYTKPFMALTDTWTPGAVTNLKLVIEGPYESDEEYKANVLISWIAPCRSNGEIEFFLLDFIGARVNYEATYFQRSIAPNFNSQGGMVHNETNLMPEYTYTVSVVVMIKNYTTTSSENRQEFLAPAGIPKKLSEADANQTQVDAYEANNPTNSAVVRFPVSILESDSGTISYVAILISEKTCNPVPQMRYGAINSKQDWPDIPSWNDVYVDNSCIRQYQTTPLRWEPTTSRSSRLYTRAVEDYDQSTDDSYIEYTIGIDNCKAATGESQYQTYCNGPLKADTEYNLVLRLFTNSGYNDAALVEFKTDSLIQLTLILVSVSTCLFLAFVAGFVYFWITKRMQSKRQSCHGIEDSFGDINAKNFAIYYREISKPDKIAREFKELTMVAIDLSTSASELGTNKNRYSDIFPYDKNRVILDIDAEGSDYINASFIDGYRRKKEYIATQGPKPESTMDFWRMILQHNVKIIVMVTQFREGNTIKCHEYFPYKSKGINVTVKKKDSFELYDRTEMTVTHDKYGLKQKLVHFFFKKWNDHDCPMDPVHLITFMRKVKAEKVPSYSPIVVHCSAGVGRTGTFIGLDIVMQRLKSESKINIYETVKKLRFQRMKMVQTLIQYRFLYTCAYELVKHKDKKARDALKYEKKNQKKVSFNDELEVNANTNGNKRLNASDSDLGSIVEEESIKNTTNKQIDALNYDVATISNMHLNTHSSKEQNDSADKQKSYMENNNQHDM